jgi:hypothetical protein
MGNDAAQTRSPQTVYASFTIRRERTTVIGLDTRVGSIAADQPRCYRPTHRIIRWETLPMSRHSYPTPLTGFVEGNWTRVLPMLWVT